MNGMKERYAEFLKSEFWKRLSFTVRKNHGFRCQRCGVLDHCQAHHKFYREDWYQTQPEDLECVCRECHEAHHGINQQPRPRRVVHAAPVVGMPAGAGHWTRRMLHEARRDNIITKEVFKALYRSARKEPRKKKRKRAYRPKKPQYGISYWAPRKSKFVNRGTSSN